MRNFTLFIFLLGISCRGVAQQKIIDSLTVAIKKYNQQDTVKLNMLTDLVFYYKDIDPAKGIETADEALDLATVLRDQKRLAIVFNYIALNYINHGNSTTSLIFF